MAPNALGRAVTLQGPEVGRSTAQYLITRHLADGPFREWPNGASSSSSAAASASAAAASPLPSPAMSHPNSLHPHSHSHPHSHPHPHPHSHHHPVHAAHTTTTDSFSRAVAMRGGGSGSGGSGSGSGFSGVHSGPGVGPTRDDDPFATPFDDHHHGGGGVSGVGGLSGEVEVQLMVPHEAVAFLIGRAGAVVTEVEHKSGAKVKISRPAPSGMENLAGRLVTVRGFESNVAVAQALIHARVDAFYVAQQQSASVPASTGGNRGMPTSPALQNPTPTLPSVPYSQMVNGTRAASTAAAVASFGYDSFTAGGGSGANRASSYPQPSAYPLGLGYPQ